MKRIFYRVSLFSFLIFYSCAELDLNPLSEAASGNWYSSEEEMDMSVNGLFRQVFWPIDEEFWADDQQFRTTLTPITNGSINGETAFVETVWAIGTAVVR